MTAQTFRALQSAGAPHKFWAAVYSRAKNKTEIGVYNTQDFSFKSFLTLPEILLDSTEISVDAAESKVYFIYGDKFGEEKHLLMIPLPTEIER